MMTKEQLLKPRYKVIADYPNYTGSKYVHNKGDIIVFDDDNNVILWKEPGSDGTQCDHGHFLDYPAIFKSLNWWSDRKVEDMPEFIKDLKTGEVFVYSDELKAHGTGWMEHEKLEPATKEEYEEYLSIN